MLVHASGCVCVYLDDLVLWPEACSICGGVVIHGSDVLAWLGLLTVQVEAIAVGSLHELAKTRPQFSLPILQTQAGKSSVSTNLTA